jgi:hypothetical protein
MTITAENLKATGMVLNNPYRFGLSENSLD